jgi:hypothetical protein
MATQSEQFINKLLLSTWEQGFEEYIDLEVAKKNFINQDFRTQVLKNPEYDYNNQKEVKSLFYGAMLKQMLQGDGDFVEQNGIIAINFDWYVTDGKLMLNPRGINAKGQPKSGKAISSDAKTTLYDILKATAVSPGFFKYTPAEIMTLLGFEGTLPSTNAQDLLLYPVVVRIDSEMKSYFSLGASVLESQNSHGAYGPPCPPFFYPPR